LLPKPQNPNGPLEKLILKLFTIFQNMKVE